MSKLGVEIAERLADLGVLDRDLYDLDKTGIERTRAGHWQRAGGAWSWSLGLVRRDGGLAYDSFGSQWTATECAKAKVWDFLSTGQDVGIVPVKG
jgi:hypothetical protein